MKFPNYLILHFMCLALILTSMLILRLSLKSFYVNSILLNEYFYNIYNQYLNENYDGRNS